MTTAEIKVTLYDGSIVLKKWERPCQSNPHQIIETLKQIKETLNDYLTELINFGLKDQVQLSETSDRQEEEEEEEEEAEGDSVSGFIKGATIHNEKSHGSEKRKINFINKSKKLKM